MTAAQIERLKKDSRAIEHQVARLRKRGKESKAHKLMAKREFLNQTIQQTLS